MAGTTAKKATGAAKPRASRQTAETAPVETGAEETPAAAPAAATDVAPAEDQAAPPAAPEPAEPPADEPPADVEPKYSRDRVLSVDGVRITGQPAYVLAGALEGDPRQEFTRDELLAAVKKFFEKTEAGREPEGEK